MGWTVFLTLTDLTQLQNVWIKKEQTLNIESRFPFTSVCALAGLDFFSTVVDNVVVVVVDDDAVDAWIVRDLII